MTNENAIHHSLRIACYASFAPCRDRWECCFLSKLDSLTSPTSSCAPLIRRLPICLNSVPRQTIRGVPNQPCRQCFTPIQLSLESFCQVTVQHSSLCFDFSHTDLCESSRFVIPSRARLLDHFNTFQTRDCRTEKRSQCPLLVGPQQQSFPSQTALPSSEESLSVSINALLWHLRRCQAPYICICTQESSLGILPVPVGIIDSNVRQLSLWNTHMW